MRKQIPRFTLIYVLTTLLACAELTACSSVPVKVRDPASINTPPAALVFSEETVNFDQSIHSKTFTITNSGGSTANGIYVSLNHEKQFLITNNHCGTPDTYVTGPFGWNKKIGNAEADIPAGATCTFDIIFETKIPGTFSDIVTVSYLDGVGSEKMTTSTLNGIMQ